MAERSVEWNEEDQGLVRELFEDVFLACENKVNGDPRQLLPGLLMMVIMRDLSVSTKCLEIKS